MLELESLSAVSTLEAAQDGGLVMTYHVSLQSIHICKLF